MSTLYYSIRFNSDHVPWDQHLSQPIDMIMTTTLVPSFSDPERTVVTARYQYPKGRFIMIHKLDEWEYDMLDAFDVPVASDEMVEHFIGTFEA